MSDQEALIQAIARLRDLRGMVDQQKIRFEELQEELSFQPEWQDLQEAKASLKALDSEVQVAEAQVRELALEVYRATGEKRPAAGVQIKLTTRLVYDVKGAITWVWMHLPDAIKLDVKFFEKQVKKGGFPDPPPVKIIEEPAAYIDAELPE